MMEQPEPDESAWDRVFDEAEYDSDPTTPENPFLDPPRFSRPAHSTIEKDDVHAVFGAPVRGIASDTIFLKENERKKRFFRRTAEEYGESTKQSMKARVLGWNTRRKDEKRDRKEKVVRMLEMGKAQSEAKAQIVAECNQREERTRESIAKPDRPASPIVDKPPPPPPPPAIETTVALDPSPRARG